MEFDIEKIIPENRGMNKGGRLIPDAFKYQTAFRWQYNFREQLCKKMKRVDKNINVFGIRALTAEIINFIDGRRTISEVAESVGYEYGVKIKPEHVLEFLLKAKEQGYIHFKTKD